MGDTTITRDEAEPVTVPEGIKPAPVPALAAPPIDFAPPRAVSESGAKLRVWGGIVVSLVWVGFCGTYVEHSIGWSNLMLLQPQEMGGIIGAAFVPLAFLWLLLAYFDRGRQMREVGDELARQLARLTYPVDGADQRVKRVADSLRTQAQELSQASSLAVREGEAVGAMLTTQIQTLSELTGHIGQDARGALDALKGEVDRLTNATQAAQVRAQDVERLLRQQSFDLDHVTEATVAKWFKAVGEAVKADEPLVELETDKVTVEVPAPAAGVLAAITVETGATVEVGAVLGTISAGSAATAGARRRD